MGIRTSNLPAKDIATYLLAGDEMGTGIVSIPRLKMLIDASSGPTYTSRTQIYADTTWEPGVSVGRVVGDVDLAKRGFYLFAGALASPTWTLIGPLPDDSGNAAAIASQDTRLTTAETKLAGIAPGATANATDAALRARADHTGVQSADTVVDGTANKVYTAAEKIKMAGIATGATANATDAALRARADHTGVQTADTVVDGTLNKVYTAAEKAKATSLNLYVEVDGEAGGFLAGDEHGRYPIRADAEGAYLGGLIASFGDGDIVFEDDNQRSLLWLDEDGAHLEGFIDAATFAEAVPDVQVDHPIIGPDLFFVTGAVQKLYPRNIQRLRTDHPQAVLTFVSDPPAPAKPFHDTTRDGPLKLIGDEIGSTGTLIVRTSNDNGGGLYMPMVARHCAVPLTSSVAQKGIWSLTDSIGNRQTLWKADTYLTSWGCNPRWIGTFGSSQTFGSTTASGGPLGETREGWAWKDFFAQDTDDDVSGILAPGDELLYAAMTKDQKRRVQIFCDSPGVLNLNRYFNRFIGGPLEAQMGIPDIGLIGFGMNDSIERGAGAPAEVANYMPQFIDKYRADVSATGKLLFYHPPIPRGRISDARWINGYWEMIATTIGIVNTRRAAGDANIFYLNSHALMPQEAGYNFASTGAVFDPLTGFTKAVLSDEVHPINVGNSTLAYLIAQALACLLWSVS